MSQNTKILFIFILAVTLFFGYIVAPIPNKPNILGLADLNLKYGIDLDGGAELRYRVLFDKTQKNRTALTQVATDVIRKRVEARKLQEPIITAQGDDQIIIQLAGMDKAGVTEIKKLIEKAGNLELFAVANREIQVKYNEDPNAIPAGYKVYKNVEAGKRQSGSEYKPWQVDQILLRVPAIIDGDAVTDAKPAKSPGISGVEWYTTFTLDMEGGKRFDAAAEELYGFSPAGMIAIVLDDEIQSTPAVQTDKFGGEGRITGASNESEASQLAIILKSGSLPAQLGKRAECPKLPCPAPNAKHDENGLHPFPEKPEAETFVGPSLGEDSIRRGIGASLVALGLVALFMIVYYRKLGFIAVITLALNLIFLLGAMSFFNATLTLPGIAGIVLTVGMAVDANILIFERIREEQNKGKTASQAFEAGHERAFSTIIDANVTTLIAAIVLFYFGTGPVQGFAVTLWTGIASTLFSVLVCGKTFMKMLIAGGTTEFKMMRLFSNLNINYMRVARPLVVVSAVALIGGMTFFFSRGSENFGPDFKGGTSLSFAFNEEKEITAVRQKVLSITETDSKLPKYSDARVQTVADPGAEAPKIGLSNLSRTFQLRTGAQDEINLQNELLEVFQGELSHPPFELMKDPEVDPNPRRIQGGSGPGWIVYLQKKEDYSLDKMRERVATAIKGAVSSDAQGKPRFYLDESADSPKGTVRLKLGLANADANDRVRTRVREQLQAELSDTLSQDPVFAVGSIGPAVAAELKDSTIWAMGISWILMIAYIAIRFTSWRYGVAAVIALIHDAGIAIAFTSLVGWLIPESWGLSFEMNVTTMAAILAIIGYSINDTIVLFDRVRENLLLEKKATFTEIINKSINQTMARTVLTSATLLITVIVLYGATMNTGGGIAEFSFPLIIGVIVGTYSSIWVASAIVLWWYRGQRPQLSTN